MNRIAPLLAMMASVFYIAFLAGIATATYQTFPYTILRDAGRTLNNLIDVHNQQSAHAIGNYLEPSSIKSGNVPPPRWKIVNDAKPHLPILAYGGLNQYLEQCPDHGCLAVTFDEKKNIVHYWPYFPKDIFGIDSTNNAYPHEHVNFDPLTGVYPTGIQRYSNGDLLVNFQSSGGIFPFSMGVARIKPDGTPRWTRFDYSHHWSTLLPNETAYVPALIIGNGNVNVTYGAKPKPMKHTLTCNTNKPQLDIVQIIDGNGKVIEVIDLISIFLKSNWSGLLTETTDNCDPLHLNYIDVISKEGPGLNKGDLVLSLRNISRFMILDPIKRKIKKVVSGTFVQQHSVQHLSGSKFLIFDNRGGDEFGPASRIVEKDLQTGYERRIFPNSGTQKEFAEIFSDRAGFLDISPDRKRVLASFTHAGRAFEVDINSGRLLSVFDNLHNISTLSDTAEVNKKWAGRFTILGMSYIK